MEFVNMSQKNSLTLDNICLDVEGCIYTEYNICIEGVDGYSYHSKNKTCIKIIFQFLVCKYSCYSNSNKCCKWKKIFYLLENDSLC